jgi:hypothetical protein
LETFAVAKNRFEDWSDQYGFEFSVEDAEGGAAVMVLDAYDEMVMTEDHDQQRAIADFAKHAFEVCFKQMTARANGVEQEQ